MEPLTLLAFILILSLLVFVHELGHFIVAKRSGITVEEFAIGFPPRAVKLWQEEGSITLDGHEYVLGRKLNVPRDVQPGAQVYVETGLDEKGRPAITKLQLIKPAGDDKTPEEKPGILAKLFASRTTAPDTVDEQAVIAVDAITRPTEYALNWVPFGGYVRMVGEEDPTSPGSFASKSKKVRLAVLAAGSTMNLIAAIVLFTLTFMAGIEEPITGVNAAGQRAPVAKTLVSQVLADTPASEAGLQANDLILGADTAEFKYEGDLVAYVDQHKGQEVTLRVERNGQIVSASLTPRLNPPAGQGAMGVVIMYSRLAKTIAAQVMPNTPAAQAGLQAGDVILGADTLEFKYDQDLVNYIEQNKGKTVTLRLERAGQLQTAALSLPTDLSQEDALGLRIRAGGEVVYYPLHTALLRGASQTAAFMALPLYLPVALLRRDIPLEAARPTGPVGIFRQTALSVNDSAFSERWSPVLGWTAILSAALALTNLLPLPALDGGRIFFIIIEAIRGKRVAPEKEGAIHFIGLVLLLTMMLVITYYDIIDPIPAISLF